jgi:hypothetical protein
MAGARVLCRGEEQEEGEEYELEENSRRADEQGADPDNTDERKTELTIVFVQAVCGCLQLSGLFQRFPIP